jgi:hypothetical protein
MVAPYTRLAGNVLNDAQCTVLVREHGYAGSVGSDPPPRKPVMTLRDLMQDLERDREDR